MRGVREQLPQNASEAAGDRRAPVKQVRFAIKVALIAGFGALIAIIIAGGFYSLRTTRQVQERSKELRADFLAREGLLEDVRSDLFESGNVIRDYILAGPDDAAAAGFRSELESIRSSVESQLSRYSQSVRPAEGEAFRQLSGESATYFAALSPALNWTAAQRKSQGDSFLRREVLPRRTVLLAMAKEISQVNEQVADEEEEAIEETFRRSEERLEMVSIAVSSLGIVLAAITVMYTLHLENISEHRYEQSVRIQGELKELSAKLVDTQESERRAISRELHDEVGQSLSSLLMEIDNMAGAKAGAEAAPPEALQKLRNLAQGTLHVVRDMSLLLRPSMLDDLGLIPALEWQAREVFRRTGLSVSVVENNVSESLNDEYKTCIYRIVQEALNNASKYAGASKVEVVVRQEADRILLTIQDDGKGFDSRRVRGLGLMGVSERAERLGGQLFIESRQGQGTLLRVALPLVGSRAAAESARR